jgi:hypothetical protein
MFKRKVLAAYTVVVSAEGFQYAPVLRPITQYLNHPKVKPIYLSNASLEGYRYGIVSVSKELSSEELADLEWSRIGTEKELKDALAELHAKEYIEAYRENPEDAIATIEQILSDHAFSLEVPREKAKKYLLEHL